MIVHRRTFVAKRGRLREAAEFVKRGAEQMGIQATVRVYISQIGPFDSFVGEAEFEDWDQYSAFRAAEQYDDAFWEEWFALTENGGTNEVWQLLE